ncbi:MAG: helix-turn-helix transcriptional regulator [Clostridiales bacterium]|nr:helix-turn-helix transcriptional regulator [Clostridiales bacterium]
MEDDVLSDTIKKIPNLKFNVINGEHALIDSAWSRFATIFPYSRLYYIVSGNATIYLKNKSIELKAGNIYYIPPYSISNVVCHNVLDHYWIHFNMDLTTEQELNCLPVVNSVEANNFDKEAFIQLVDLIDRSHKNESVAEYLAQDSLLKYLFSRFLPHRTVIHTVTESKFLPVLAYIDENLGRKITNEELSKIMFLNPTYFSNSFSSNFGISPQQYILQKKLNKAINLLYENEKSIKEIAFLCGFENESYFNRQFKKIYGIPPGKFLKRFGSNRTSIK